MAWFRRRPTPPEDVKIHLRDGRVIAAECVYLGKFRDDEGQHIHRWRVVNTKTWAFSEVDHLSIGMLPAYTQIDTLIEMS